MGPSPPSEADGFRFDVGAGNGDPLFPPDCTQASARTTNLGCEFWAVDLPNDARGTALSPPAAEQQFAVVVANPSGLGVAEVEVFRASEDVAIAGTMVPPGEARTIPLPSASIDPDRSTVDGEAFRIASSLPITAYQFNPLDNTVEVYSNDASLLFPTEALGTSYTAITADAIWLGSGQGDTTPVSAGAFVSVVGTVDGTRVEIEPTSPLVDLAGGSFVIDRGFVLTGISSANAGMANLSGTRILSDHPVAVFSGNVATAIPSHGSACCADHVEHQMPPHTAWGNAYGLAPAPHPAAQSDDPVEYRIVGAFDGTELLYCPSPPPGAPTRLDADEIITFTTARPFTVRSVRREHTFAIAQFLQSYQALDFAQPGDPAMLILPPTAQYQPHHVFVIPEGYAQNVATVIRSGTGEVLLDGSPIDAAQWQTLGMLGGQSYTYAHLPVEAGAHLVESKTAALGLSVFGFDEAVSYAFPGGAGVRVISIPPVAG